MPTSHYKFQIGCIYAWSHSEFQVLQTQLSFRAHEPGLTMCKYMEKRRQLTHKQSIQAHSPVVQAQRRLQSRAIVPIRIQ